MKKIIITLFTFIAIVVTSNVQAQSFQIFYKNSTTNISGQTISVTGAVNGDDFQTIACDIISVKNISANTIKTRCTRSVISAVAGSENNFCWGLGCYGVSTNTSPLIQSPDIAPSAIENTFVGDYKPHLTAGTTTINYVFYNNADIHDTVSITVIYDLAPMGVDELSKGSGTISAAYPNPANSFISLKYDMNEFAQKGKIVFHDMLGKLVKEITLTDKQGIQKVNTIDLNAGVYFYTFMVDNKAITTKKIIITH